MLCSGAGSRGSATVLSAVLPSIKRIVNDLHVLALEFVTAKDCPPPSPGYCVVKARSAHCQTDLLSASRSYYYLSLSAIIMILFCTLDVMLKKKTIQLELPFFFKK